MLTIKEPTSFKEASQDERWMKAMEEEIQALEKNGTWEVSVLPEGERAIDNKWVYKIKFNSDGFIERFKARLVTRGDKQIKGKEYNATFSPVAKFATVRTLIALATIKELNLHQLDINNAFLHGYLEEDVYMKVPEGCSGRNEGKVCKLKRSLYGLKQASRQWNIELKTFMKSHNFKQCTRDYSVFLQRERKQDMHSVGLCK